LVAKWILPLRAGQGYLVPGQPLEDEFGITCRVASKYAFHRWVENPFIHREELIVHVANEAIYEL
jgi:hypothetical protein